MMQGYVLRDHNPNATFELFVRELPPDRGYLVLAGINQVLDYLENLSFSVEAISYLEDEGFESEFLDYLSDFTFTGSVRAIPEGSVIFPNEPVLEVSASMAEAQLVETLLINQIGFQTLIATKASRMIDVVNRLGEDQPLVDFGSRRAHGTDAGMKAARASYLGGFAGTSNVAAGESFDIPLFGTMAHSWVESFETERKAFEEFVEIYGEDSILLIDTYDTIEGARTARSVADERGLDIRGVRIDSGDLVEHSREVREETGDLDVYVSSGVDEYLLKEFFERGGTATGFGVGTNLVTSADAPKLEAVYKLMAVERDGSMEPVMKLSSGKETFPGRKTVCRITENGKFKRDTMGCMDEELEGEPLLTSIMEEGTVQHSKPDLQSIRARVQSQVNSLPEDVRSIREPVSYPVDISNSLRQRMEQLRDDLSSP